MPPKTSRRAVLSRNARSSRGTPERDVPIRRAVESSREVPAVGVKCAFLKGKTLRESDRAARPASRQTRQPAAGGLACPARCRPVRGRLDSENDEELNFGVGADDREVAYVRAPPRPQGCRWPAPRSSAARVRADRRACPGACWPAFGRQLRRPPRLPERRWVQHASRVQLGLQLRRRAQLLLLAELRLGRRLWIRRRRVELLAGPRRPGLRRVLAGSRRAPPAHGRWLGIRW